MLRPKEYLYFYRILNWENKISGIRPIGYTLLGFLVAGHFNFLPLLFLSLAELGALMFVYSLNDYFDWKIQKERNFLSSRIKEKKISEKQALFLSFLPAALLFFIVFVGKPLPIYLFLIGVLLLFFYSFPPLRFKDKRILGFLIPPLAIFIHFLRAYLVFEVINIDVILLAVLVLFFQGYLETLHVIGDSQIKEEIVKVKPEKALQLLKYFPLASVLLSIIFALFNSIFLISTIFSLVRLKALTKFKIKNIHQIRVNLFSPELSLYEFGIYGVLGLLGWFR